MGYYTDFKKYTLTDYKTTLASAYLPPSRMVLKEQLNERFSFFENMGISNIAELIQLLKKKDRIAELSKSPCFSETYLTILLRELNSIHPKPNMIEDFTGTSMDTVEKLKNIGVKNSEQLYNKVLTAKDRLKLSESTGIDLNEIQRLTKLSDLSRIKYVGVTFAHMLYILGVDSAKKASQSDPDELHTAIARLNQEKNIYKGQVGINDIRIFVDAAKEVSFDIDY